ncbi:MAG: DciA family protein [Armatimonadota bacterium]|nr:DciA family protein [bacterium]MDW8320458.1 DciA family protein [Armatimonadota bacterium]
MSHPDLLRDILDETVDALGLRERLRAFRALLNWEEVVGKTVAAAAQPEALKGGKVFVAVKSNAWIQELRFQQQTILQRLNEYAGVPIFTELVFRVNPRWRKSSASAARPEEPNVAEPELDASAFAQLHTLTEPIADAEMRAKVTEYLVAYRRLVLIRKQQGWRECSRCGCYHPGEGSECPFCRGELT